ncbi:UNVERIFIED_CONTAM: hypothetical protein GTU68_037027 [Idotea baltica]|nr:hypothetical protein [Idotea baltica]
MLNQEVSDPINHGSDLAKRAFDIFVSFTALLILSPFIAIFALLIFIQDGASPLFAQDRYGRDGKTFRCFKLRSMVVDAGERLKVLLENDPAALTKLGAFVRKMSIDELPQLFNVLKGEMSLVGPRRDRAQLISHILHVLTPGLTGL